jgi:hypothetical protein
LIGIGKMSFTRYDNTKSPKLKAVIVEHVLISCIEGISICELALKIQIILPLPNRCLKRYLFYLINYELVSYDGQRQLFITEEGGFDLLHMINKEKKMTMANSEDIMITIE